jgi:nitroreductase
MDEPDEMQLTKAMRTTGAVRAFRSDEVPDRTVYEILDDARFAPSGGNRQGWRVVVVRDPELRVAIRDLYVLGWREYMAHVRRGKVPFAPGSSGSYEGPAVDLTEARRTPSPSDFSDHLDAVPVMLIVLVELGALAVLDNGLARQSIVGGGSIYPFTHNILLAARARGLGGVMTTVICREERAVKE